MVDEKSQGEIEIKSLRPDKKNDLIKVINKLCEEKYYLMDVSPSSSIKEYEDKFNNHYRLMDQTPSTEINSLNEKCNSIIEKVKII